MNNVLNHFGVEYSTDITTSLLWQQFMQDNKLVGAEAFYIDNNRLACAFIGEVRWYSFLEGEVLCTRVCTTL